MDTFFSSIHQWTLLINVLLKSAFTVQLLRIPAPNPSMCLCIWGLPRCCGSVAPSCPTLCSTMDCSTPGFPVLNHLLELAQTLSIESEMSINHLILCRPLLLLPSIFPSIRVFSNESALHIRWPKYWSFSFSIVLPINIQD